ncbi:MAG: antitoxin [Acidimicrobiia bacterium]
MGMLDDLKRKAQGLIRQRNKQIKRGLDKAGEVADTRTGGKHSDKIGQGVDKAKDIVDKLGE